MSNLDLDVIMEFNNPETVTAVYNALNDYDYIEALENDFSQQIAAFAKAGIDASFVFNADIYDADIGNIKIINENKISFTIFGGEGGTEFLSSELYDLLADHGLVEFIAAGYDDSVGEIFAQYGTQNDLFDYYTGDAGSVDAALWASYSKSSNEKLLLKVAELGRKSLLELPEWSQEEK